MENLYKWNGKTFRFNERYNSVYCEEDVDMWIPAIICDGIRYMAAFHVKVLVVDGEEITYFW